ncbi:SLBB domain-containing protein [Lunatimonas salinarum]|uniref:SLBB domain-containing protein n=1 Tax=Lunatimonas salinarum TaxID=1774590 RepID=UPI001ADFED15|nr:SLBB domain-containing protein [Lunatimonas salinarum]
MGVQLFLRKRIIYVGLIFFSAVFVCVVIPAASQSLQDISSLKVDDLTDEQLQILVRRAEEAGLTESELVMMAQARGVPQSEINKLRNRLENMDLSITMGGPRNLGSKRQPRRQTNLNAITQGVINFQEEPAAGLEEVEPFFGLDLFYSKNRRLSFEPNYNLATPQGYVIGPGDVIYIDIYGQSEKYLEGMVTPEGSLILDNVGPIGVSGKTVEEATALIKSRLSRFYTGLGGSTPNTFLQVSLGNLRTIQVHLVGELRLPGTFTLSSLSTVFNALYAAGGPNVNGSMRSIKVIRNDRQIAEIDVYEFLTEGKADINLRLQDQDIILVQPFLGRVRVQGEVKRPMIFEVKEGETFQDVLTYSGGFTDEAFRDRISVSRTTGKERAVSDIFYNQFSIFDVKGGDTYTIGRVLDRYSNRVQIKGAVFREGNYALSAGLTLKGLIDHADGLRGEAYLDRASILRTNEDLTTEIVTVNLRDLLEGRIPDIALQREDVVRVSSIYDLQEEVYVQVTGEVRNPGTYPFSQQMTVEDLIVQAGGLRESASTQDVEIARRAIDPVEGVFSTLIPVTITRDLVSGGTSQILEPFDNLVIRRKPNFSLEKMVYVEGQVNSPGTFVVRSAQERISDVIQRAGGLTSFAYAKGATLIRRTEYFDTESEQLRRKKNLIDLQAKLQYDPNDTEAQDALLQRLFKDLDVSEAGRDAAESAAVSDIKRETVAGIAESKGDFGQVKIRETEAVAIDLEKILQNPGSAFDLILEEGDIISIPRQLQTVRLRGDVVYPTTVRYEKETGIKYYINRAGGFDIRANRKRTYVVYANGEVSRTKNFFGLRVYPAIEPGAEVFVPTKGPRIPIRPGELVGLTTGLATLVLIISQINR